MHHIALEPGGQTVMLRHPGEAVYYVKSGGGTVEDKAVGSVDTLVTGAMIHVEPHTPYRFVGGERGMTLLGGPAPHDPTMYAHL
jgi:quercetin dioxygenase-like cupin family protein